MSSTEAPVRSVSVVIPVYQGAQTLPGLVKELAELVEPVRTPGGHLYRVGEVILVWDRGPDHSDEVIRSLALENDWVRPVFLSRNFGQHAATQAGMVATGGEWIVTMDEDGQHDPADIALLLDAALEARSQVAYAAPSNPPPHGFVRNTASRTTKWIFTRLLTDGGLPDFHSFRLLAGEVGRSVAAYAGPGMYFDVALSWAVRDAVAVPIRMRDEGRQASNYTYRRLAGHFWRMVVSTGTKPLRLVALLGTLSAIAGVVFSLYLAGLRIAGETPVQGWTSVMVAVLVVGGLILLSLGIVAEYIGSISAAALGRPSFVVVSDPQTHFEGSRDG